MAEKDTEHGDLIEKTIKVRRVAKVVKGGRRFSFSALVVVGDGRGKVGFAMGKANEVTEAIRKATEKASKAMKPVVRYQSRTVPHEASIKHGACRLVVKPGSPGKGIIASGTARAVLEAVGIADISVKNIGSRSPQNVVETLLKCLHGYQSHRQIAKRRGVPLSRLYLPGTFAEEEIPSPDEPTAQTEERTEAQDDAKVPTATESFSATEPSPAESAPSESSPAENSPAEQSSSSPA